VVEHHRLNLSVIDLLTRHHPVYQCLAAVCVEQAGELWLDIVKLLEDILEHLDSFSVSNVLSRRNPVRQRHHALMRFRPIENRIACGKRVFAGHSRNAHTSFTRRQLPGAGSGPEGPKGIEQSRVTMRSTSPDSRA